MLNDLFIIFCKNPLYFPLQAINDSVETNKNNAASGGRGEFAPLIVEVYAAIATFLRAVYEVLPMRFWW